MEPPYPFTINIYPQLYSTSLWFGTTIEGATDVPVFEAVHVKGTRTENSALYLEIILEQTLTAPCKVVHCQIHERLAHNPPIVPSDPMRRVTRPSYVRCS
ncbi:hypothetical protein TNIN_17661 [Trichonephila inaurata madagascariensis]|uniref:Uncharacterized protein n=1 Tax=Trichonephila inaurata madagascariensis TaxID=2747483 RepID=A0A8X7BVT4_9ARAC|nr:hypothetical protein TNIN_17661 [Trichonephila inaurata madagascariensis]